MIPYGRWRFVVLRRDTPLTFTFISTVGLVSHLPCVTDSVVYPSTPSTGSTAAIETEMNTAHTPLVEYGTLYLFTMCFANQGQRERSVHEVYRAQKEDRRLVEVSRGHVVHSVQLVPRRSTSLQSTLHHRHPLRRPGYNQLPTTTDLLPVRPEKLRVSGLFAVWQKRGRRKLFCFNFSVLCL